MVKIEHEINQKSFRNEYQKLLINIMYTSNWIVEITSNGLKPFDLTPKQYNVLRILRGQHPEPVTVKLIRERMLDKMSDASRIVERLRLKGLVKRDICDDNRRAVDVYITDIGLELLEKIDNIAIKWENEITNISESEAQIVNDLLDRLRDKK